MMRRGSDDDSSPQPNRLPCSSSPTDECPVFANLSPLKPEKAEPYRFSGTNYPSPRQLFTSPNLEQTVFRDANSNGHEHSDNVVQNPTSGKEIKSCSPSQECSASAIAEPNRQQDDGDAGTRALVCLSSPKQVKPLCSHKLDETTGINKRADELSDLSNTKCPRPEQPIAEGDRGSIMLNGTEYDVGNFQGMCPSSNSYINCRPHSNISSRSVDDMDTNKTECGIRRRLDFETENGSTSSGRSNIYTSTYNLANVRLPASSTQIVCDAQEKETLSNVQAIRVGELNPKRKRKRVSVSETEGCKQCNCKRSKCLKLYCECFASGIYCLDSCACANCYNKPEYEDTVHDARQQIESRNPHAFAPKVVPRNTITNTNTNTIEQDIQWTSARHKRGCNCKKSKCLKKYCECYQSKVGCSDGCRCDNCHNSFGTKTETAYGRVGRWKNETHNAGQVYADSIKAMGGAQLSSSTWQQQVDITRNFTPSAPPCSEVALYSASSTLWNYAQASQTQFGIGPRFLPHGSFNWPYPLNICTQQLQTSEVLSHDYSQHEDITEDDNIPQIIEAVKSSSPN